MKAQPQVQRKLWLEQAPRWLQGLEIPNVFDLVQSVASGADLYPLAAERHEYARAYFQEAR